MDGINTVKVLRPNEIPDVINKKCSWLELKMIVNDLRREIATVSSLQPMQISFKRMPNGKIRIYYLVNSPDCWGIPLLYANVPTNTDRVRLVGRFVMDCLPESSSRRSREQQQLSERQRSNTCGLITNYQVHPTESAITFPMADGLYILNNLEGKSTPLLLETRDGSGLAPVMCPRSSWLVAHTTRGDLWLTSRRLRNPCPIRLTYACREMPRLADDPKQAGIPSYVMQEEFSRYTGFWWQPTFTDGIYRILYEEIDESGVDILSFPSYNRYNGDLEEFRFPHAGTTNGRSILRMVQFKVKFTPSCDSQNQVLDSFKELNSEHGPRIDFKELQGSICDLQWFDLRTPLEEEFPWLEYIPRIGWTPCGQYVWCQILDRRQQKLDLILIPLEEFCVPFRYDADISSDQNATLKPPSPPGPDRIPMQVLLSERNSDGWINVHDILHFLPMNDPTEIRFIWASEETGHLHLYLVSSSITGSCNKKDVSLNISTEGTNMESKLALTKGDWEIIGKKIWVDEEKGLVYFIGLLENPLERHLYCISYQWEIGDAPKLLTESGYSNTIEMDEKCEVLVISRSNLFTRPTCQVFKLTHNTWGGPCSITLDPLGPLLHPAEVSGAPAWSDWTERFEVPWKPFIDRPRGFESRYTPELYTTRLCGGAGEEIHAMVFRPVGQARDKPCPTVLHVYGGPVVQTVTNTFKGMRQLRMHMMAARGYCVVCIDSRGSKHRGVKFEAHIRRRMGTVELEDQIEVLKWLADHIGCIDLNRVAVHGWSYGGYLSLMALVQHPDLFKICVACAPVTSWHLYNTAYTERYMDLPNLNPTGYARGSVLKYADKFPDQENRLLIVHGLQDENVHFLHTQQLIEALVRAGKPYQLQVYPGERHSLRHPEASAHYEATLLAFLQNYL